MKCRACFADCNPKNLLSFLEKCSIIFENSVCIAEAFSNVTQIKITSEEKISNRICSTCCDQLRDAYTFILKSQQSNLLFRNLNVTKKNENKSNEGDSNDTLKTVIDNQIFNRCIGDSIGDFNLSTKEKNDSSFPQISEPFSLENNVDSLRLGTFSKEQNTQLLQESEIKQEIEIKVEPEPYDEYSFENNESVYAEALIPTAEHIKVEPLSKDAALMYHQQSEPEDPSSLLNGYHEEHFFENEVKPSQDDLLTCAKEYTSNILSVKPKKHYECQYCGKSFSKKKTKEKHEEKHNTPRTEKCLLCNKIFNSVGKLKNHVIMSHSYGEPLECQICKESFPDFKKLDRHMDIHLPENANLKCKKCPQAVFSSERQFKKHLWFHKHCKRLSKTTEEFCRICNRGFINKAAIISHYRHSHKNIKIKTEKEVSDEKVYENAMQIKKEGGPKGNITDGMKRIKIPSKKYLDNNGKPSTLKTNGLLQKIRRLKRGLGSAETITERKFECVTCKFRFKRKDHLKRHMSVKHKLKLPKEPCEKASES